MDKKSYESLKDIRNRVATGQTTTFSERNWMNIQLRKQARKNKLTK